MSSTEHLLVAFCRASQNRNLYDYFAAAAKKEGFQRSMKLFEQTAEHERAHAKRLLRLLDTAMAAGALPTPPMPLPGGRIGSTLENLRVAVAIEREEHEQLYPSWSKQARAQGEDMVGKALESIAIAHSHHARMFAQALAEHESQTVFRRDQPIVWLCSKCGYVQEGVEAPVICPACLHPQSHFEAA